MDPDFATAYTRTLGLRYINRARAALGGANPPRFVRVRERQVQLSALGCVGCIS